jgi:hypothetical protein
MKRKVETVSGNERRQIVLEQKYHPKRARELIVNQLVDLEFNNDPIWTEVLEIVESNVPSVIEERDEWVIETTYNLLSRLIVLEGKNTPIQSIVFAFVMMPASSNATAASL